MKQKSLKIINYNSDHLDQIDVRDHEGQGLFKIEGFKERMDLIAQRSVETATAIIGGEILCISGYYQVWEGVVEVWTIPSKIVPRHYREFAQYFKKWMATLEGEGKYHRIQTTCPDDRLHARWLTWLGFKKEGVMKKYTQNREDYAVFAKVF